MASLYGRPPRPQKKTNKRKQIIRNERKQSVAISNRRQLNMGYNEK